MLREGLFVDRCWFRRVLPGLMVAGALVAGLIARPVCAATASTAPASTAPASWPETAVLMKADVPPELGAVDGPYAVTLSGDGRIVAAGWVGATAATWDVGTGKQLAQMRLWDVSAKQYWETGWSTVIALSPDAKRLVTGRTALVPALGFLTPLVSDKCVWIWDTHTGRCLASLVGSTEPAMATVWSPDQVSIATASSSSREVTLWDAQTGQRRWVLTMAWGVRGMSFSPDSQVLAVSDGSQVLLVRVSDQTKLAMAQGHYSDVAFLSDGSGLAVNDCRYTGPSDTLDCRVTILSADGKRTIAETPPLTGQYQTLRRFALVPNSRHVVLLVTAYRTPAKKWPLRAWVYDWGEAKEVGIVGEWEDTHPARGLAVSGDGSTLAILTQDQLIVQRLPRR